MDREKFAMRKTNDVETMRLKKCQMLNGQRVKCWMRMSTFVFAKSENLAISKKIKTNCKTIERTSKLY